MLAGCCVLNPHTDLQCSAVFPLKRLEVHADKGEAAGQVGIGIFGVSASVRAIERGFLPDIFCVENSNLHSRGCTRDPPGVQSAQEQSPVCQIQLREAKFKHY